MRKSFVSLTLLLALCLPVSAQQPDDAAVPQAQPAYFSITSEQTYMPGETPVLNLWANNVNSLEFRVYKVKDPAVFFQTMKDLHSFGGRAPKVPHQLTLLERFHAWKRDLATSIRDYFRGQFSSDSRHQIRAWMTGKPPEQIAKAETFAAVPLLNKDQVVAVWRQNVTISTPDRWETQKIPIPVKEKGVYLIEATNRWLKAYTVVIITDVAMVVKLWHGHALAFVVDSKTGDPIANAQVYFGAGQKKIAEIASDADGLAEATFTDARPEDVLIMARARDQVAVNAPETYSLASGNQSSSGYVYTDRPVYRPGHIVHFKALLRTRPTPAYQVPSGSVQIQINDAQDKTVYQKNLTLSKFGSVSGDYAVPESASLGNYTIRAMSGGEENQWSAPSGNFFVEEYKKPEYQVRVIPDKKRLLQGEQIGAVIEARYFFGEPVAGAKVTYVLHREPSCRWCDEYSEEDEADNDAEGGSNAERFSGYDAQQQQEKTGVLDSEGRLRITLPTKLDEKKNDLLYRIEARVTDQGNREIPGSGTVLATYGSFRIAAQPLDYWAQQGITIRVRVKIEDYDKNPIATEFRLEAIHRDFYDKGNAASFFTSSGQTDSKGEATVEVPASKAGSASIHVTADTPEKRTVEDDTWIWITGDQATWAQEQDSQAPQVQIVPDKKLYHAGDTAKLQIITGTAPTTVLVTTEGSAVYTRQVVKTTSSGAIVEVPVKREQIPTLWANVALIQCNRLRVGTQKLKISTDDQRINLTIKPSKDQYQPGASATYDVESKDKQGKPVSAEVSVGVVDEAIYSVRPEQARDIMSAFYSTVYDSVATDSSLNYYFQGEAGTHRMQLARLRHSNPFGDLKPEPLVQPKVRKAFPDTAYWSANVQTDSSGHATVHFDFPDALTQWRTTARAVTLDTMVGSTVNKVIVRKNLLVRLVVPRFFRQGDEVTVSTLVHNYLKTAKKVSVSMDIKGLTVLDGATKEVIVESRGEAKVDYRVRADDIHNVTVLGKALTNEESDAMEVTLPVIPYGVKQSVAAAGAISDASGEANQTFAVPAQALQGTRSLNFELSPSLAGTIFGALDYLTSYPYGCTEQTMSSFLPNVVVSDALKQLQVKSNVDKKELDKKVQAGMDRLLQFQHEDGGWGWWQTDDSAVFMTAYVLQGMSMARSAGYPVNQPAIDKGRVWLQKQFDNDPRIVADLQAYIALVLIESGSSNGSSLDSVWENRSKLTPYGLATAGLAFSELKDRRIPEVVEMLERTARSDSQTTSWDVQHDWYLDLGVDTSAEATAYAVKFLLKAKPDSPLIPKAVLWLTQHRNDGYFWESTKQTAMVIYGITDYLRTGSELRPDFSVQVMVNDQTVLQRKFTAEDALSAMPITFRLGSDKLGPADRVRIVKKGIGRLYWSVNNDYFSEAKNLTNKGTFQLSLAREYYRLSPVKEGDKVVYQMDRLTGPVQVGDTLAVHLTVSGSEWRYLLAEDPIPAGTEFIEKDDLYELKGGKPSWWGRWFTHREFHDDRAAFFQEWFSRGQTEYFYLLKVVNPGIFKVSPAQAMPMYQPEFTATTDALRVEAK